MEIDKLLSIINNAVDGQVDKMCSDSGQMTLGELAARLESCDPKSNVIIEGGSPAGDLDSYRGFYRMIAIEFGNKDITVKDFLKNVNHAIGNTFTGYKGGEFKMSRMTPVWVSSYGSASGIGLVDLKKSKGIVTLITKKIEED